VSAGRTATVNSGSLSTGWAAVIGGLRARGQLRLQRARDERDKGLGRLIGLAILGGGIAVFILVVAFAGGFYARLRDAEELGRAAVAFSLLGLITALILSSLGHAATAFFASHDLWYWDSSPAPKWSRFVDRLSETIAGAVPATLTLGALAIAGLLLGLGATPLALSRAVVAVGLVAMIPVAMGVSAAHVAGALLPAGKLRRLSLLLLGVATFLVMAWLRNARLERVVTAEGAAQLLDDARSVEDIGAWWWPHNLGSEFVLEGGLASLGLLAAWSFGGLVVALLLHVTLYTRCRDLAADESPEGLRRGSIGERALFGAVGLLPADLRPVALKDALTFVRDPSQWSQLVLLVGIAAIYAVNCRALVTGFEGMVFIREVVLSAVHVGIVTFISAGLAARFAFTQVGIEGFSVWMVESSPVAADRMVLAKFFVTLPIVGLFPVLVAVVGAVVLELRPIILIVSTLAVLLTCVGLVGLGVGRGAVAPVLDAVSVAELSMGPGALSTMATAVALCGLSSTAMFFASAILFFRTSLTATAAGVLIAVGTGALIAFIGARSLRTGAAAFERRRLEGTAGAPTPQPKR
jgi:ABC-2 type transport system permease protein